MQQNSEHARLLRLLAKIISDRMSLDDATRYLISNPGIALDDSSASPNAAYFMTRFEVYLMLDIRDGEIKPKITTHIPSYRSKAKSDQN